MAEARNQHAGHARSRRLCRENHDHVHRGNACALRDDPRPKRRAAVAAGMHPATLLFTSQSGEPFRRTDRDSGQGRHVMCDSRCRVAHISPLASNVDTPCDFAGGKMHGIDGPLRHRRKKPAMQHRPPRSPRLDQAPMEPQFVLVRPNQMHQGRECAQLEPSIHFGWEQSDLFRRCQV